MKTTDGDRLHEIEVTQATLRANIQQSQTMIDKSRELLEKQRIGRGAKAAPDGGGKIAP